MPNLEEVFKVSGVPTYTFVPPERYDQLKISIRSPGRCSVIEGPSGIGKTSCVTRIIDELGLMKKVTFLSARKPRDLEYIRSITELGAIGIVIIDDFHRLDDGVKAQISDYVKVLADEGRDDSKVILIGINKAGDRLVQYGADVGLRIDIFKLESNPPELVEKLISLGEEALNISIGDKSRIRDSSYGSFQIAQMLCQEICVKDKVTETQAETKVVKTTLESVTDDVVTKLRMTFHQPCMEFAQGSKLRREGRAPYLWILKWLTESTDWSVDLRRALKENPEHRGSVGQVVSKGYLETLLKDKAEILDDVFHYQPETMIFTVEDPKVVFYLKSINWTNFVREVGFTTSIFKSQYDIALSFAGSDRAVAKALYEELTSREVSVFYDENEQHRIISEKIEDYLAPIYTSEASYVVPLLSKEYPTRIWTRFESEQFKGRFGTNGVIPIRYRNTADGYFSASYEYGSLSFDPSGDVGLQIAQIADVISRRLEDDRLKGEDRPVRVETVKIGS